MITGIIHDTKQVFERRFDVRTSVRNDWMNVVSRLLNSHAFAILAKISYTGAVLSAQPFHILSLLSAVGIKEMLKNTSNTRTTAKKVNKHLYYFIVKVIFNRSCSYSLHTAYIELSYY